MAFVLRAFSKGADGVIIIGCHLNECNYTTQGNFHALSMTHLCKKLMEHIGIHPGRLRIAFVSGSEATRFVEIVDDFSNEILNSGPLGRGEGLDASELKSNLGRVIRLVPYIKIQKKEKLQARLETEEAYSTLFTDDEVDRLLHETISYYIDPRKCRACMICAKQCPVGAIDGGKNRIHVVDQDKCIKCSRCFEVCPPRFGAVTTIPGKPPPSPIPEEERIIIRKKRDRKRT